MSTKKPYNAIKSAQGARREAHFKAGKTLAMWLGAAVRMADRKKAANRNACRNKNHE